VRQGRPQTLPTAAVAVNEDQQRVAAAYINHLPGDVANLGGVRAVAGAERQAAALLRDLATELQRDGIPQIQAVVGHTDHATQSIVQAAGFSPLTEVEHLWLDLRLQPSPNQSPSSRPGLRWLPAQVWSRRRMEQLIARTFVDTLDCPALNGLRSPSEVLTGFLDKASLRTVRNWELLVLDEAVVGCLLMSHSGQDVSELAYMGVVPEVRGQRLGESLIQRAFQLALRSSAPLVVVAVDRANLPVLRLYRRAGFSSHGWLSVWLWPPPQG